MFQLLSECLFPVPMVSPTLVTLPVDPFAMLAEKWELSKFDVYEPERWKAPDADVMSIIRRSLYLDSRTARVSDRSWESENDSK